MPSLSAELLERFVDDLTDYAIIVLDIRGKILTWNAGAHALFGYDPEDAIGRDVSDLYSKADNIAGRSDMALKDAAQWGRHDATVQLVAKGGLRVQTRMVLRPLLDSWQRLSGFGLLAYSVDDAGKAVPQARVEPEVVARLQRDARIMVVDDDLTVLVCAVEHLTHLGYRVVGATSGDQALATLESGEEVDLLLTDVVMPGEVAGRDLAHKALEMRPGLKVLFTSGYFEGALVSKGALEVDVQFIAKPYRLAALADKVAEVLGASP
jgi:PAS domain S-box-containing protein